MLPKIQEHQRKYKEVSVRDAIPRLPRTFKLMMRWTSETVEGRREMRNMWERS